MKQKKDELLSTVKFAELMSGHTTFQIGGPADLWVVPRDLDELKDIIKLCRENSTPVYVIGNGSNLLIKDKGIRGCVLTLSEDSFKRIEIKDDLVTVGAGFKIGKLLGVLFQNGLGGLEFLAGIPATIGGALVMNAGWRETGPDTQNKTQIGDFLEEITVLDENGQMLNLAKKDIMFRYRGWNLRDYIVLEAKLKLVKSDKNEISEKIKNNLILKRKKQELAKPSAGCIFKNPEHDSAGRLIDVSGLKGRHVGGAMVSTKHANFIINIGKAKCEDVLRLMDIVCEKVKKDHGVFLDPEVKILGQG